ncbi:MAG TPA: hypothetical protein VHL09_15330, partial [Dehalococcoidia bacterium]|nr:hypothetical protein [Dehalococcoidia bacterium]
MSTPSVDESATPAWEAYLPDQPADRPPILLIHGAANSAWIWADWGPVLAATGWEAYAIALR